MTLARPPSNLPSNLPSVTSAKLPLVYESAREALAACERIDECKDWADKMAAMASYAKQADDRSLEIAATKIRARAIRRCGELLEQMKEREAQRLKRLQQASPNGRKGGGNHGGGVSPMIPSAASAAREAGLSRDQQKTAQRVARIPAADFESAVESDDPPTVTELAERGTRPRHKVIVDLKGRDPAEYRASTSAQGAIRALAEVCDQIDPEIAVRGAYTHERPRMAERLRVIEKWSERVLRELEKMDDDNDR